MWLTRQLFFRNKLYTRLQITRVLILNKKNEWSVKMICIPQFWTLWRSQVDRQSPHFKDGAHANCECESAKSFPSRVYFNLFMLKCRCGEALPALQPPPPHTINRTWRFPIWLFHQPFIVYVSPESIVRKSN